MRKHGRVSGGGVFGLAALLLAAAALCSRQAWAQTTIQPDPARVQIIANVKQARPGEPFEVGVHFQMEKGWHIYWRNPGDAGVATLVEVSAPKGFGVGPVQWPRPETFTQPGDIVGYGYTDEVMLTVPVSPPATAAPGGKLAIAADVSWLACKDLCVPGKAKLSLELPLGPAAESDNQKLFATWHDRMPPMAPDLTLQDQDGREVKLSDYAGRVVVLEWFNPDCPYVKRHHEERSTMRDLAEKYAAQGVVWLAVNSTYYMPPETTKQWRERWHITYPILIDREGKVGQAYGAKTTPHMFIIDKLGEIVYQGGIDDDPRGRSAAPTNYVDKALAEVLADKPVTDYQTRSYGCSVKYPPSSE